MTDLKKVEKGLLFLLIAIYFLLLNPGIARAETTLVIKTSFQPTLFSGIMSPKKNFFFISNMQKLVKDTVPTVDNKNEFLKNDSLPKPLPVLRKNADDTLVVVSDSLKIIDSAATTSKTDTIPYKLSKNALTAPVEYFAEDSSVIDVINKKATLYGKESTTNYLENDITSPLILFDQETGDIIATMTLDSNGRVVGRPVYKSSDFVSESDSFRFNMNTGKGLTKGTYTQQGEMYVYGESIKKVSDEVFYALRGNFTTCNLDTPHFAFVANKIKFINDKVAISGPVHPEIEGVPIPIYLPFGIFPLSQQRHSGILSPTFVTNQQRGLGLEGLGYYKVLGEFWDVILRTSIYSYGGWTFNINPRYSKRYHYNGNFSLDVQHFNFNFKGDPDFAQNRSFNFRWSHTADMKSRPGVSFSANVNFGSSSYNAFVPNNPMANITNSMTSSIRYGKTWKGSPFNLTMAANHNQNTNLNQITIDLPSLNFSMNTIYPFRRKEMAGESRWYENIGIGYRLDANSTTTFYDTVKNKSIFNQALDTLKWGAQHVIPISLSLPPMGVVQMTPSMGFRETWFQTKSIRSYNTAKDTMFTRLEHGFYSARQVTFGMGLSTRIFGMLTSKRTDSRFIAMRHELRPTVSLNYTPDLQKNNYYILTDSLGRKTQYSFFESRYNIYGAFSSGQFGGMSYSFDNNLSMKVRNRKDTGDAAIKKISILDAFSISGSYNFLRDSLKLSPVSMNASTNLFNKVNVSAYANFDLYEVDEDGRSIDRLIWKDKPFSFGRMTNTNLSLSTSFQGGNKQTGESGGIQPDGFQPDMGYTLDEYNQEAAYINAHPGEYADFNIPWSLNLSYSLTVGKTFFRGFGFRSTARQNLNLGGTLNLTPKWQLGVQTYFNITDGTLDPLSMSLSRDLHCWQMAISVGVGRYKFFTVAISPKSPLLRDLRINKTQSFISL